MKKAIKKAGLNAEDVFPIFKNSQGFNRKIVSATECKNINGTTYYSLEILHKEIKNKSEKVEIHTKWTSYGDTDLHYLVFGTPFIDKLVGKVEVCPPSCDGGLGYGCGDADKKLCWDSYTMAKWHLAQMADPDISRYPDKLKDYVRGLV